MGKVVSIQSPLSTVDELAAYLRVHRMTIYKWHHERRIPARKIGGKLLFHKADIEKWLETKATNIDITPLSKFQSVRAKLQSVGV